MILEQFSATIDKIYAAAVDRALWSPALSAVEEISNSAGAVVNLIAKDDLAETFLITGARIAHHFSEADVEEYNRDLLPRCPRVAAGIANPSQPLTCDYMILSESEMDRQEVYQWFGRHGLKYFIGSTLGETGRYRLMWSLQRTPSQGHVQHEDVRLFELLKPHVARAVELADQLGTLRSVDRFSSAVLEALPQAVFALDRTGKLLFANTAGASVLAVADGLYFAGGKLHTRLASEQARLDTTIREAALVASPDAADGWVRVSRASGARPYALFVAPLNAADEELTVAEAKVLVIAHDTAARACVKAAILTRIYGLTDAEARLASALSGGHSLESAAISLGIKPATAKSELKAVFLKIGVNRQQDLVRVLSSMAMLASPPI